MMPPGFSNRLFIELWQIEPMESLRDGNEINGIRFNPTALRRCDVIVHALALLSVADLFFAGVCRDDRLEMRGQRDSRLAAARRNIPGDSSRGSEAGEIVKQRGRIGGPEPGVFRRLD
jgi:hypothetical protein